VLNAGRTVREQQVHDERAGLVGRRRAEGLARKRAAVEVEQQHQYLDQELAAEGEAAGAADPAVQVDLGVCPDQLNRIQSRPVPQKPRRLLVNRTD
jgi:hypothetical protein